MINRMLMALLGMALLVVHLPAGAPPVVAAQGGAEEQHSTLHASEGSQQWTCGMHPSVRMDEPGKCPICNMDLVPVREELGAEGAGPVAIELGERARFLAGVATSEVRFRPLFKEIRTVGRLDYDERRVANVAAWVEGRIDRLFVNFTGTEVRRGTPLAHLYSPSVVSTGEEYLFALKMRGMLERGPNQDAVTTADALVTAARNRLLRWGITERQIAELEDTGTSGEHVTIVSPISGTVVQKLVVEGNYVKEGDHLYHVADLSNLWVYADIYESDMSWVREGQDAHITTVAHPGEMFHGTVAFIDPFLDERTRSVKVRIDMPNPERKLKPGMFASVSLRGSLGGEAESYVCPMHPEIVSDQPGDCPICGMDLVETPAGVALAVPKSAMLDTGRRTVVYVEKEPGRYEARDVVVGPEATAEVGGRLDAFYPVRKGLMEGERVVTRGNFLIDSQRQLAGPAASMYDAALGTEEAAPPVHRH